MLAEDRMCKNCPGVWGWRKFMDGSDKGHQHNHAVIVGGRWMWAHTCEPVNYT